MNVRLVAVGLLISPTLALAQEAGAGKPGRRRDRDG